MSEPTFISPDQLVDRRLYAIRSRNLVVGVWNAATQGFIGIREKFDDEYLFTEYEWESGGAHGTARAEQDLGIDVPPEIAMGERLDQPSTCSAHRRPVEWVRDEMLDGRRGKWFHLDDGSPLAVGDNPQGPPENAALFVLLRQPTYDRQDALTAEDDERWPDMAAKYGAERAERTRQIREATARRIEG